MTDCHAYQVIVIMYRTWKQSAGVPALMQSHCAVCQPQHKLQPKALTLHPNVYITVVVVWRGGSMLVSINEVNLRRDRLVMGWVTVSGFNSPCRIFISVCNQPRRSTQPSHPFVGRRNEYQPKGGDALRLGSKGRYGSCVGGR